MTYQYENSQAYVERFLAERGRSGPVLSDLRDVAAETEPFTEVARDKWIAKNGWTHHQINSEGTAKFISDAFDVKFPTVKEHTTTSRLCGIRACSISQSMSPLTGSSK